MCNLRLFVNDLVYGAEAGLVELLHAFGLHHQIPGSHDINWHHPKLRLWPLLRVHPHIHI